MLFHTWGAVIDPEVLNLRMFNKMVLKSILPDSSHWVSTWFSKVRVWILAFGLHLSQKLGKILAWAFFGLEPNSGLNS